MADPTMPQPSGFRGINTRLSPERLGWAWLSRAENVVCDDSGHLRRRPGYRSAETGVVDLYATRDGRLFLVDAADNLLERQSDGAKIVRATGASGGPFAWTELGNALFLMSPRARWAIYPDRIIPWGALCPTLSPDAYPIDEPPVYPPPLGEVLATRRDQILVGVYEPSLDRSAIYASRPGYPHEFRLERDFALVPGRITLLASVSGGVIAGTDRAIYVDPIDAPILRVADYGVPAHSAIAQDGRDTVWFWTHRGLCVGLPFANLTDAAVAAASRFTATAAVLPWRGSTYAVVHQSGDAAPSPTRGYDVEGTPIERA